VVTPVTTTPNGLQTGYANNLYPLNNGYQVSNGFVGGINSLYPSTGVSSLNNNYQFVNGLDGTSTVIDRTTGVTIGYLGANGVVIPVNAGINSLQTGYGNGYQFGGGINPLPNGLNTLYPSTGVTNQGITNGLTNTALNQYNSLIQNGYGSLYSSTMGTGLNGMNGYYPNTNGFGNGMNPYLGQQQFFGYNGYPFTGQQYGGYPLNGNS
uniref:Uncharacterized protein n=1 Tax=Panagrolaimus sp. ES5 TaxID=591445 RepID=A0AC34GKL3_9BILA